MLHHTMDSNHKADAVWCPVMFDGLNLHETSHAVWNFNDDDDDDGDHDGDHDGDGGHGGYCGDNGFSGRSGVGENGCSGADLLRMITKLAGTVVDKMFVVDVKKNIAAMQRTYSDIISPHILLACTQVLPRRASRFMGSLCQRDTRHGESHTRSHAHQHFAYAEGPYKESLSKNEHIG